MELFYKQKYKLNLNKEVNLINLIILLSIWEIYEIFPEFWAYTGYIEKVIPINVINSEKDKLNITKDCNYNINHSKT